MKPTNKVYDIQAPDEYRNNWIDKLASAGALISNRFESIPNAGDPVGFKPTAAIVEWNGLRRSLAIGWDAPQQRYWIGILRETNDPEGDLAFARLIKIALAY